MQLFSLLPATLLLAAVSAQETTWSCPAASNTNATIAVGDKNYNYNIQCDTHYFGDEVTRFYVQDSNLEACAKSCSEHQEGSAPCKAATVVSMTSTCILRSSVGDIAQRPGLLTAVLESVACVRRFSCFPRQGPHFPVWSAPTRQMREGHQDPPIESIHGISADRAIALHLTTQTSMESRPQQMPLPQPPSRKRTKLSSSNTINPAIPDALHNSASHRPGLVPNPEWSQATWKDHIILAKDQFASSGHIYINKRFTNVELIENCWYEMFCPFCGANNPKREEESFFKSEALKKHMRISHRNDSYAHYPRGIEDSDLVRLTHVLSHDEVKALRSGKMIVKTVRGIRKLRVRSEQTPCAPQNDTNDEEILREAKNAEQCADQKGVEPSRTAVNDVSDEDIMHVINAQRITGSSEYIPRATSRTLEDEPGDKAEHLYVPTFSSFPRASRSDFRDPDANVEESSDVAKKRKRISYSDVEEDEEDIFGDRLADTSPI
ncbi:uncharacterized protein MYCFIDRAFT_199383 [Pseudocercospora fijiensis CIRAD86]|uniref:Apple domain-containing protein n=1 Tax=Pseudocercospora fijiensis (strain CIRAD86) TaxID=383855 RepID=M3AQK3_PSEFD|nr:uncharacterized protein MYCFIDRAFT_199383 [Pseudocercospora fijiensis CIRAD86]EME79702.1 hypothetical protein MYCFIDRAFT_199383 [Pseudocercospora fijiensis CIRAD86]